MIMAIETRDMVIKKMVYLYLCNYAHKEPDMAIMCINTLRRDCDNEDPMVRGLALRSLCNLRIQSMLEYIEQPLQKSLTDTSAYVRKTGVMAVLKVYSMNAPMTQRYIPQLYSMIQDIDSNVVTNAIMVLNEMLLSVGGMEITQATVMHLLNRIGEFSEWGLNTLLDIVARYVPTSEEEIFAIMNLLDPVLRTASSNAVLGTTKCFLNLSRHFPELETQIYGRAKPPLLTLITGGYSEMQYVMLKHLELILNRQSAKGIFDDDYRQFFVRYNEPSNVKHLKVDLMPLIANANNARDIATELGEYVTDVDSELSKRAIKALSEIAMRVGTVSSEIVTILVELVDLDMSYVRAAAVRSLANIIRVFPDVRGNIFPYLGKCLRKVDDSDARSAVIWMLGEYCNEIVEAPYMLESIIDSYSDESSVHVKLHTLSAAMKIFFKRPPEMQLMLGRLLHKAVGDVSNQDVHDRALMYYRLLNTDVNVASRLFQGQHEISTVVTEGFAESKDSELRAKLFSEFNTLAIVYGTSSDRFIDDMYQLKLENAPMIESFNLQSPLVPNPTTPQVVTTAAPAQVESVNLLDWGDVITTPTPSSSSLPSSSHTLVLKDKLDMQPPQFQQLWSTLPDVFNGSLCVLSQVPLDTAHIENLMRANNIFTMASGLLPGSPSGMKFFFYCMEEGNLIDEGAYYLMQFIIISTTKEVQVTVKSNSTNDTQGNKLATHLKNVLDSLL